MVGPADDLRSFIRSVPDFPKKGIVFRDITTLLQNKDALRRSVDQLAERYSDSRIDKVVGIESRGFIFGGILADRIRAGFVPVRKPNKLPSNKIRRDYKLEYGADALEIHIDAIHPGERVLVVDDLLATGGTAKATCDLVCQLKGDLLGAAFLIELGFLNGRKQLTGIEVFSLISYDSE